MTLNNVLLDAIVETCDQVREDATRDAMALDHQPFNGRTLATNLGYVYASIAALATRLSALALELRTDDDG